MQKIDQLICLSVFLVLVAASCLARNVENQAGADDVINKIDAEVPYCYNTTILYNGCDYSNQGGNISVNCDSQGNFTYTDCCTDCKPDNAADASVHRRHYLKRYVNACSK